MSGRDPGILARGPWTTESIHAHWREEPYAAGEQHEAAADSALAELRERGSPTHDGLATRLAAFEAVDSRLTLELQPARWALRLATDAADSLSALCVVRDADGRWLAGRRAAWVASWPGRWALGAGGAVEIGESPAQTLVRELEEEWSVQPERMSVEALLRSPNGLVLLVGLAHLPAGAEVERDPEHDDHAWWPADPNDWPEQADVPLRLMAAMLGST